MACLRSVQFARRCGKGVCGMLRISSFAQHHAVSAHRAKQRFATHSHPALASKKEDEQPNCWSCGSCVNKVMLFCGKCEYIQPLHGEVNYFELLEIPQQFDVLKSQLEGNFKRLQKSVHPDRFGTKTKREQDISLAASSKLNVAYKILRSPISRAQYLLQLHGIDAIGESAGSGQVDSDLLMEVMEAREVLEDPTTHQDNVLRLHETVMKAVEGAISDLSKAFSKGDLKHAADITVALQYYSKLRTEAEEWLAERRISFTQKPS